MTRAARVLGGLALIGGGPYGVTLMSLLVWHRVPVLDRYPAAGWAMLALGWGTGLAGVHLLPASRPARILLATIYTPAAAWVIVVTGLAAGCAWYGWCP